MDEVIFVVIRHITKKLNNSHDIWKACYNSIRKFYSNKIIVIDNNSDYSLFNDDDNTLINCEIINSQYPENRLFSPFFELLKIDFNRAVIIHDGVIFQKYVDFTCFNSVKYIWHFDTKDFDNHNLINKQLDALDNNTDLHCIFKEKQFVGCMGCCLAITKTFLNTLQERHNIQNLVKYIENQEDAIAFERTISLLCCLNYPEIISDISFEGEIRNMSWGYRYSNFINNNKIVNGVDITDKHIIKIFCART
jgi:hypothetical protein